MPLFGSPAPFQSPSSSTGGVAVTPGRLVISAAVSDSRMRRLTREYMRSANRFGLERFSFTRPRRTRSVLVPPVVMSGRLSGRAPVRPLRR